MRIVTENLAPHPSIPDLEVKVIVRGGREQYEYAISEDIFGLARIRDQILFCNQVLSRHWPQCIGQETVSMAKTLIARARWLLPVSKVTSSAAGVALFPLIGAKSSALKWKPHRRHPIPVVVVEFRSGNLDAPAKSKSQSLP